MEIQGDEQIANIFSAPEFSEFSAINIMPLIYDEKKTTLQYNDF